MIFISSISIKNDLLPTNLKFFWFFQILVLSIRCYQCSTQTDVKGSDSCGAYKRFNSSEHIAIECNSDESHMPGSFCMKVVQQGPRGFICMYRIEFFLPIFVINFDEMVLF